MRSTRPLLASAAALAAFALVATATSWAQTAEIEIVGVVGATTTDPFCQLGNLFSTAAEGENTIFTLNSSGPTGGRVDILQLADQNGQQQAFRTVLGASLECSVGAQVTLTSDEDGLLNRDTGQDYVDYEADLIFEGAQTARDGFITNQGDAPGTRSATISFVGFGGGLEVRIASLANLPQEPLADGTYADRLVLEIQPQ